MVSSLAFAPLQTPNPSIPLFEDTFSYLTDGLLNGAFSPWKDGAKLAVSLAESRREGGGKAMRVDLVGPNERSASRDASVFRILELQERRWDRASAARFWLENPSDHTLALSFNFKEKFNEYWATSGGQVFFLESEDGVLLKQDAQYGNLPIPAGYSGFVVIPFAGMAVPEWNTARGDFLMDTSSVESFAIGIRIDQHYPRHFYVDDFQILAAEYPYLEIGGPPEIDIPTGGELRQQYEAAVFIPGRETPLAITPSWKLSPSAAGEVRVDEDGWLVIPAGTDILEITLSAQYSYCGRLLAAEKRVLLKSPGVQASPPAAPTPIISDPAMREKSVYEKFSDDFEEWTFENRPLFVAISVGAIVLVLAMLAYFQRRMG